MTRATMASATGRIRGTMQGSCLPRMEMETSSPPRFTVRWVYAMEGVGFTPIRATIS